MPTLHLSWSSTGPGQQIFFSSKRPDRLRGPPSVRLNGYRGSFAETKRPAREVNHSLPPSVQTKNEWSYISTPSNVFMAWTLHFAHTEQRRPCARHKDTQR